jgi:hypothetical protein
MKKVLFSTLCCVVPLSSLAQSQSKDNRVGVEQMESLRRMQEERMRSEEEFRLRVEADRRQVEAENQRRDTEARLDAIERQQQKIRQMQEDYEKKQARRGLDGEELDEIIRRNAVPPITVPRTVQPRPARVPSAPRTAAERASELEKAMRESLAAMAEAQKTQYLTAEDVGVLKMMLKDIDSIAMILSPKNPFQETAESTAMALSNRGLLRYRPEVSRIYELEKARWTAAGKR